MSALTHAGQRAPAYSRSRERGGARLADLAWLTWRQHRTVIIAGLVLAAAVTGSTLYVAARITAISHECGHAACPRGAVRAALGGSFGLASLSAYLTLAVMLLPLQAGMFLGVPLLAREHEQRTLLPAWSQDVTPRWLWTKLAILGAMTARGARRYPPPPATWPPSRASQPGRACSPATPSWSPACSRWYRAWSELGGGTLVAAEGRPWRHEGRVHPLDEEVGGPVSDERGRDGGQGAAVRGAQGHADGQHANSLVVESPSATIYDASGHPVSPACGRCASPPTTCPRASPTRAWRRSATS
jgi:hypothetical protein